MPFLQSELMVSYIFTYYSVSQNIHNTYFSRLLGTIYYSICLSVKVLNWLDKIQKPELETDILKEHFSQ